MSASVALQNNSWHYAIGIEPQILTDVKLRRCALVFDLCNEGHTYSTQIFDELFDWMEMHGLPPGQVVWLAQNRNMESQCRRMAGPRADWVRFEYYDFFIKMIAALFAPESGQSIVAGGAAELIKRMYNPENKDRLLLCLNATPRVPRVLAVSALVHYGLLERSLVSFPGVSYTKGDDPSKLVRNYVDAKPALAWLKPSLEAALALKDLRVDDFAEKGNELFAKIDTRPYERTFFSLVTETEFTDGSLDRVTEKIAKPFCLGHPPLVVGNPRSVRFMTELGFQDWDSVFDRAYEFENDPPSRFGTLFGEVMRQIQDIRRDPTNWLCRVREVGATNITHAVSGQFLSRYCDIYDLPIISRLASMVDCSLPSRHQNHQPSAKETDMGADAVFYGMSLKNDDGATAAPIAPGRLEDALLVMKPKPSPYPLTRVGGSGDGAYLLPNDLLGIKACFSPGVNNFKHFEDYMTDHYGMACHMCDKSSDIEKFHTPLKAPYQTFKKRWLDIDGKDDSITLEHWVNEFAPCAEDDLLLQIDIEGAEYRNILQAPESVLKRFRIIAIELHGLSEILRPNVFAQVFRPFLEKIDRFFVCVHAHPNNCCGEFLVPGTNLNLPNVHELTFLRRDRFIMTNDVEIYPPLIPHPLDIERNVSTKPPLFLSEGWTDGRRAPECAAKLIEDKISFERYQNDARNALDRQEGELVATTIYEITRRMYREMVSSAPEPKPDSAELVDLAAGRPFMLSSCYDNTTRSGVVSQKDSFFFHTQTGINESITIDLEQPCQLWNLRIRNRTNMCYDRARLLFYVAHESADFKDGTAYPIEVNDDFMSGRQLECDTNIPGCMARFVTIFSPTRTALHFSAINILGIRHPSHAS